MTSGACSLSLSLSHTHTHTHLNVQDGRVLHEVARSHMQAAVLLVHTLDARQSDSYRSQPVKELISLSARSILNQSTNQPDWPGTGEASGNDDSGR